MSSDSLTLSPRVLEVLASRICHDLISPVGAVGNGIELLEEFGLEAGADAVDLIGTSAKKANIHLRAFRWAYGASGADSDVKPADVKSLITEYISLTKASFEWHDAPVLQAVLPPRGMLKNVLNLAILAAEGLGIGGSLAFDVVEDEPLTFSLTCEAQKFTFKENIIEALEGSLTEEDLTPRNVHGYITRLLCEHYCMSVSVDKETEGRVIFKLSAE